jgi:uncharacterized FlaG/YvyC family protein
MVIFIIIILGICIYYELKNIEYDKSKYKEECGNNFLEVIIDKGKYGEYLSFNKLEKIKGNHKILTNVYLPKGNEETIEIDLVYIHETGIYILESKNYSGWIFGDEKNEYWMHTLKNRQKEKFYNPLWQNNTHIEYLKKLLKIDENYIKSIIVFSERCTIKTIVGDSENVKVINRYNLNKIIEKGTHNSPNVFSMNRITELYDELKSYTCISVGIKESNIKQVQEEQATKDNYQDKYNDIVKYKAEQITFKEINENIKFEYLIKKDSEVFKIYDNETASNSLVVRKIKDKLDSCGGKATIKLFRGDSCEISYDFYKRGLSSPKIPMPEQLTWEVFNAAIEVVINNGGKALKGSARSKGARLGNEKLPMSSVEGYIAHKVHDVKQGESSFGAGFVICAILEWAGICNNELGFLTIKPSFLLELEENKKSIKS